MPTPTAIRTSRSCPSPPSTVDAGRKTLRHWNDLRRIQASSVEDWHRSQPAFSISCPEKSRSKYRRQEACHPHRRHRVPRRPAGQGHITRILSPVTNIFIRVAEASTWWPGRAAKLDAARRLARIGVALSNWSERWFPDPLVFALVGIVVVFLIGVAAGEKPVDLAHPGRQEAFGR